MGGIEYIAGSAGYVLIAAAALLALLIIKSTGKMKCASKLGFVNGWMAFIPVLNEGLTGAMAEKCDKLRKPDAKPKKWSILYPVVEALSWVSAFAVIICILIWGAAVFSSINRFARNLLSFIFGQTENEFLANTKRAVLITVLITVTAVIILLLDEVLSLLMKYKLYTVFSPKKYGLWFVLTFFFPAAETVLLMVFGFSGKIYPIPKDDTEPPQDPELQEKPADREIAAENETEVRAFESVQETKNDD